MNPNYRRVSSRANQRCEFCLAPEVLFNFPFEVEHLIPVSRRGSDDLVNLALACRSCNLFKASYTEFLDEVEQEQVRLFSPRDDRWSDHFRLDLDRAEIVGITKIGRATVECLRMNEPVQVTARALWIQLRLFP